jgi:hypothetical protein
MCPLKMCVAQVETKQAEQPTTGTKLPPGWEEVSHKFHQRNVLKILFVCFEGLG